MTDRLKKYLTDIQNYAEKVAHYTSDKETFYQNEAYQLAVLRCYEVIGEIVKRLPDDLLANQTEVDWSAIMRFRDFLIHQYNRVEMDIVWSAIEKLPELRTAVVNMLDNLDDYQKRKRDTDDSF